MSSDPPVTDPDPEAYAGLVHDTRLLEGGLDLAEGVGDHLGAARLTSWGALVGALVVTDRDLPRLADAVPPDDEVGVVVELTGGAGALSPLPRWFADRRLRLVGVNASARDLDDLHGSTRRLTRAAEQAGYDLGEQLPLAVRLPTPGAGPWAAEPGPGWLDALDEIAMAGHHLAVDADGPDGPPSARGLAATIEAALDREVPFSLPRGLARPVSDPEGPGYLSVLWATRVSLDTGDPAQTEAALGASGDDVARAGLDTLDPDAIRRTRRWFTAFGHPSPPAVRSGIVG